MKKILIIEDDRDLCDIVKSLLELKGYQAFKAHTAEDGIRLITGKKPDLVIMDVMLPGMTGPEAVKELHTHGEGRSIPIIFLTGLVKEGDSYLINRGLKVDGAHYKTLAKPFDNDELLQSIQDILQED